MTENDHIKTMNLFPDGIVAPPPSKSVSHRALICAALAGGEKAIKKIKNLGASDDIGATHSAVVQIVSQQKAACKGSADRTVRTISCAESGSTLRFLIPLASLDGGEWIFTGEGRLMDRPLGIYHDIFSGCGAIFEQANSEVRIKGALTPGRYELRGDISSQFISGLLFALPLLEGDSEIILTSPIESADYIRLTVDVMCSFGVEVCEVGEGGDGEYNFDRTTGWRIRGCQQYKPVKYSVESDWSQAAFFLCAGALGRRVTVTGMSPGSLQGDLRILSVLKDAGCDIDAEIPMGIGRGTCSVRALAPLGGLSAVTVDATDIPDLVPPIAALACYLKGTSRIENAGRLRFKESDRLAVLAEELGKLGADIRVDGDSLVIKGREHLDGGIVDSHTDHRIAMALAVAAIGCESEVKITGADCVSKSYPRFWSDFQKKY